MSHLSELESNEETSKRKCRGIISKKNEGEGRWFALTHSGELIGFLESFKFTAVLYCLGTAASRGGTPSPLVLGSRWEQV